MSAVGKALKEVSYRIPPQILNLVFMRSMGRYQFEPTSVEDQILHLIFRPRVLVDCNLLGGVETWVDLTRATRSQIDGHNTVYRIPKELTGGRSIISAKSITMINPYAYGNFNSGPACGSSELMYAARDMMNAASGNIPSIGSAYVQLIGENVVLVRNTIMIPQVAWLKCIIENESDLGNISPRSYRVIAKMLELATKSYIYNTYLITLDEGQLQGGREIGSVRSIIEGYSDAEEMYQEYLTNTVQKTLFMNDVEPYRRHLKLIVGGAR